MTVNNRSASAPQVNFASAVPRTVSKDFDFGACSVSRDLVLQGRTTGSGFCNGLAHPQLSANMLGFAADGGDNGDCGGHLGVEIPTEWQHDSFKHVTCRSHVGDL